MSTTTTDRYRAVECPVGGWYVEDATNGRAVAWKSTREVAETVARWWSDDDRHKRTE